MSKESVLELIQQEWAGLVKAVEGLPDTDLLEPNVVGVWSIRDTLAHITTWEEETLKALPVIMKDQPLPRYSQSGGIDGFNAREWEKKHNLSLHQVKENLSATHQRLMTFLETVPKSYFASGTRFVRRLKWDTWNHYSEHSKQIVAWWNSRGGNYGRNRKS